MNERREKVFFFCFPFFRYSVRALLAYSVRFWSFRYIVDNVVLAFCCWFFIFTKLMFVRSPLHSILPFRSTHTHLHSVDIYMYHSVASSLCVCLKLLWKMESKIIIIITLFSLASTIRIHIWMCNATMNTSLSLRFQNRLSSCTNTQTFYEFISAAAFPFPHILSFFLFFESFFFWCNATTTTYVYVRCAHIMWISYVYNKNKVNKR